MSNADIDTAFQEALAGWDEQVRCAMGMKTQCKRTANWIVRLHGCKDFLVCGQHYKLNFLDLAESWIAQTGRVTCRFCRQDFQTVESAFTAVRL
ncbi:hypothetical protein [Mycolicibacterium frederiksbergense]|uniref:hypothetical protein n=1 Tax=Mycolicibacterium frederiksbergense TaxID=117567 RepID=UPI00265C35F7|nr:hypothetical protein [Mycolicibacterium frederiksbergense]MDO0973791.1 hypothetical protein [Mycolicibacterium frederiksbergense]